MWLKCGVLLIFALLARHVAGNCDMPGNNEWVNKDFLLDVNDVGRNNKTYSIENIDDVVVELPYITYTFNDDKTQLTFSVTHEFIISYIEKEDNARVTAKIKFICADTTTKEAGFNFEVEQTLFFEPEINKESLEFELKMPILEQSIIPIVAIEAKDKNLGDQKLEFSVIGECNDLFEFDVTKKQVNKIYSTHLKTKDKVVDLHDSMSCNIQVVNKAGKQDKAMIKLKVDIKNSVAPNPIFVQPLYEAKYINERTIQHDDIELQPTIYEAKYEVHSDTEFEDFFDFENKQLILKKDLPIKEFDNRNHITVTIEANYDTAKAPGKTIVIINSPKDLVDPIPAFEKPMYTTNAKNDYTIEPINVNLQSTTIEAPTIEVESEYQKYFKWNGNELSSSEDALPEELFNSADYITVTIEAYYDKTKGIGKTVLIINAPEQTPDDPIPTFEKPMYTTNAKDDYTIEPITIKLQSITKEAPTVEVESEFRKYFKWNDNQLSSSDDALPEELFNSADYITVTIEAYYDKTKGIGKTVLIINAPEQTPDDPIPTFEKPMYTTNTKDDYTIEPITIKLQSITKEASTVEVESEYRKYFKWNGNELSSSEDALPEDFFNSADYITVTIEAYYDKTKGIGKTVLIINAPEKEVEQKQIPAFEKPKYITDANDDYYIDPIIINLQSTIKDAPTVEVESKYRKYFKWNGNELLSSDEALPEQFFYLVDYITVTIEAYYDKTEGIGNTVVIINAPPKDGVQQPIPAFEKPIYTTDAKDDYTIEPIVINIKDQIKDNLKVEVVLEYRKYFKWNGNELSSSEDALPEEFFNSADYISVTIEAYYDKTKGVGKTVLIINAPKQIPEDPIPTFEKPMYTTDAKDDYTIEPITIALKSVTKKDPTVEVESEYRKYFKWNGNELSSSEDALPEEFFNSADYITVTIDAYYDKTKGIGKTVLIINAPEKEVEQKQIPAFEKPKYITDANDDYYIDPIIIKLQSTIKDDPTVEVESKYRKYFKWNGNELLSSDEALPEQFFYSVEYITVTIEAYYDKTEGIGNTVVIINAPPKNGVQQPIPAFEKPIYTTDAKDDYTIEPIVINIKDQIKDNLKVEVVSEYRKYFKWNENELSSSEETLPEEFFNSVDYITVTVEAYYDKTKGIGKTVLIINAPDKKPEDAIPAFKKPMYTTNAKDDYTIEPLTISLQTSTLDTPTIEVESEYRKYFKWNGNELSSSENALPEEFFNSADYITVTIEAYYDKTKGSGKTVVIINAPEDNDSEEDQIPVFENPFYRTQYKNDDSMSPVVIKLKSSTPKPIFEIESKYKEYFKLENDKFELKAKLPKDTFDNVNYITVSIQAFYDKSKPSGKTVVIIDSPKQATPKPRVWYKENLNVFDKDNEFIGLIGTFTAETESKETVLYDIVKTVPDIKQKLEYNSIGELIVTKALLDVPYFQITLRAKGKDSLNEDTMDVILVINKRINEDGKFAYSLVVESVLENSEQKKIVRAPPTVDLKIADADSKEWFEIVNGDLFIKKNIDRENIKLKDMLKSQVKTKLEAVKKSSLKSSNISISKLYQTNPKADSNDQKSCIDIPSIPYSRDIMHVVVTIEDKNDNVPKFDDDNPLIIGYPSPDLTEFIAPPYLVKVTATDEDIGINAKIRYSVDENFKIDAENGVIYPGDNLDSDTEFIVTATDRDGAEDGNKTPLKIKVKILDEKHITVITVNDMAYSELDAFIVNLGKETKTKVKYLTSTALSKTESAEEKKSLRQTRVDDKIPVLRIVMYALDLENDEIVASVDLKKLIEDSELAEVVDVKQYVAPDEPSDDTGYIAAVSTLSVLLALVLIGGVVGYIFYIRPILSPGGSIKYEKHTNSESGHTSMTPVETKMETNISARRPTGFPIGFTNLDDDDDDDSVEEEKTYEEIGINETKESPKEDQERRKSVVKFDTNVTEIEISEL